MRAAIPLAAVAAVLPFVVLAAYCHPYFDDYGTALEMQRTGFALYLANTYPEWSGRYPFLLTNIAHPLRFGERGTYQLVAGGTVLGLVGNCYLLALGLTAGNQLG